MGSVMPFSTDERAALLKLKGVGATVVARLEQMGIDSFAVLRQQNTLDVVTLAASMVGSSCWKNSPQARAAIDAAIVLAQQTELKEGA